MLGFAFNFHYTLSHGCRKKTPLAPFIQLSISISAQNADEVYFFTFSICLPVPHLQWHRRKSLVWIRPQEKHSHYVPAKNVYKYKWDIESPLWTHKSQTLCLVGIPIWLTCRQTINTYALFTFDMEMNEAVLMFFIGKGQEKCEKLCTLHAHTSQKFIVIWLKTVTSCLSCRWLYRLSARSRAVHTIIIAQMLFFPFPCDIYAF